MSMTLEQAIRILHPDTYPEDLMDIQHYDGLNGKPATLKAFDDALLLACEVMQREAERESGCEWCNTGLRFESYLIDENGNTASIDNNVLQTLIAAHCPRCGKPLNDGKVDGDE